MRETCLFCVSKHISQSIILVTEALKGYPFHLWIAVGHLAEAEDESMSEFLELSQKIRTVRLALMGQEGEFKHDSLIKLLIEVRRIAEPFNAMKEEDRICSILHPTTTISYNAEKKEKSDCKDILDTAFENNLNLRF